MGSKPEGKRNGGRSDMFGACACAGSRSTRASRSSAGHRHNINLEIRDGERAFFVPSFGSWHERRDGVERGREDAFLWRVRLAERADECCLHGRSWMLCTCTSHGSWPFYIPFTGTSPPHFRYLFFRVTLTKLTKTKRVARGAVFPCHAPALHHPSRW